MSQKDGIISNPVTRKAVSIFSCKTLFSLSFGGVFSALIWWSEESLTAAFHFTAFQLLFVVGIIIGICC